MAMARRSLPPGALDRILFSGSVLEGRRRFVLFTHGLSAPELAAMGLERDDGVLDAAGGQLDHFPVVIDFRVRDGGGRMTPE